MLDIWLVYWIPVSEGMEDAAMSTPRIPPEDCPCGKAQTCYECTHPPSERDKVLDALEIPFKELLKAIGTVCKLQMALPGDYNVELGEAIQVCFDKFRFIDGMIEELR